MNRCPPCKVRPDYACLCLVTGDVHLCIQQEHDPALAAYIVANSHPGIEPERPTEDQIRRAGKPHRPLGRR